MEGGQRGKRPHAKEKKTRTEKSTLSKTSAADYRGIAVAECLKQTTLSLKDLGPSNHRILLTCHIFSIEDPLIKRKRLRKVE